MMLLPSYPDLVVMAVAFLAISITKKDRSADGKLQIDFLRGIGWGCVFTVPFSN